MAYCSRPKFLGNSHFSLFLYDAHVNLSHYRLTFSSVNSHEMITNMHRAGPRKRRPGLVYPGVAGGVFDPGSVVTSVFSSPSTTAAQVHAGYVPGDCFVRRSALVPRTPYPSRKVISAGEASRSILFVHFVKPIVKVVARVATWSNSEDSQEVP